MRDFDETFEHKGRTFGARYPVDSDHEPPWESCDGHGEVSDWTRRDKRPGERVLWEDHGSRRYYDFAGAIKLAKRDGWGTKDGQRPGETLAAYRARAVEADFDYLRGWCADLWHYVAVDVTLLDEDGAPTAFTSSLGGVEDLDSAYLTTVAREQADEILAGLDDAVDEEIAKLAKLKGGR